MSSRLRHFYVSVAALEPSCSSCVPEAFKRQQISLLCLWLRHGATAAGRRSAASVSSIRRLQPPSRPPLSFSLFPAPSWGLNVPEQLGAPFLPWPRRAPLAAFEREGPRGGRRRAEGVPVRGARRFAVGRAQRDQARVPAPRARVPPGRQQGGACVRAVALLGCSSLRDF
jgi:hypothetical protein